MSRILMNEGMVVAKQVLLAETTAERMKGLLGRAGLERNTAMLIRPCRSIHMWFMRFSIDAAFLDANLRVLKIARDLKPWQLAFAPVKTTSVLETASGVLECIQPGDTLILD